MLKSTLSTFLNTISSFLFKSLYSSKRVAILIGFAFIFNFAGFCTIKYINKGGSGSKNGSSWSNAFDGTGDKIKAIIEGASSGDIIYVAGGTYTISSVINWKTSVSVFGGFNALNPESSPSSRGNIVQSQYPWVFPTQSVSIIEGCQSFNGRILTQSASFSAIFDGFTFQNGKSCDPQGGAIYLINGTVSNSIIQNSYANNGGGIFVGNGAELKNSLVFNNTTNVGGLKCTYDGGGGVFLDSGGKITNCHISNNSSKNNGGGIFFNRGGTATNCVISNNYASNGGGAFIEYGGTAINCTVVNNAVPAGTSTRGKGIYYNVENSSSVDKVNIINSVIWNNSGYGKECTTNGSLKARVFTCAETSGSVGDATNSISLSSSNLSGTNFPNFVAPTVSAGIISTMTSNSLGNWSIASGSALQDKGTNALNTVLFDIVGNPRKVNTIDIGAYELSATPINVSSITISGNIHTYDGTPKSVTVTVNPNIVTQYLVEYKQGNAAFSTTKPVNAGVYDVKVTISQAGYTGLQLGTLTINKATITGVTFPSVEVDFDNSLKTILISGTLPSGATVSYTDNAKIQAGTYNSSATILGGLNYNNLILNSSLKINPKQIIITVTSLNKVYGDPDPTFTYKSNIDVAALGGVFTGVLTRTAGETFGIYNYLIGTFSAGSNFAITIANCGLTILKKPITVTVSPITKIYNGKTDAQIPVLSLSKGNGLTQVLESDFNDVTVIATSANFDSKAVGSNKVVSVTGISLSGSKSTNYSVLNTASNSASVITPVPLTISGVVALDKSYDGLLSATLSGTAILNGLISGDAVQLTPSSNNLFVTPNAGTNISVSSSFALSGADASNYTLIQPTLSAKITPTLLSVSFGAVTKIYDGNNSISKVPDLVVSGNVNGDIVIATGQSAYYDNKNVGLGKSVTIIGITFTSPNNSNYTLASSSVNKLGVISAKDISLNSLVVSFPDQTKVYDGTRMVQAIELNSFFITGLLTSDVVQISSYSSALFDTKNVGTQKVVTVSGLQYSGADAINYILPTTALNLKSSITKRSIIDDAKLVVSFANQTKVFDGTIKVLPDSTKTLLTIGGLVLGDVVSAKATAAFYSDANVGVNKRVTLEGVLYTGLDAGNYSLPSIVYNDNCSITPLSFTSLPNAKISFNAQTKVYDGTVAVKPQAVPTVNIAGLINGSQVVAVGSSASYDNKNVGTNKVVTISGLVYSGKDALNYIFPDNVKNLNCVITKRSILDDAGINVSFSNQTKIFDGTTKVLPDSSKTQIVIDGLILGDVVKSHATSAFYSDANVGVKKRVTLDGLVYSGSDAGNYSLPATIYNDNCIIAPLDVTSTQNAKVFIDIQTKVYDGTTAVKPQSVPQIKISGLLPGSVVVGTGSSASYDNKNVGVNKVVTVRGIVYSGKDASNYILPDSLQNRECSITQRSIINDPNFNVSFSNQTKVFDGTTKVLPDSSKTQLHITGLVLGDDVFANAATAYYNNPNVGVGKRVTLDGIIYYGNDKGNYVLPSTVYNDNCSILPLDIKKLPNAKIYIDNQTKVYDGTTIVKPIAIPQVKITGLLVGSVVSANGTSASYDNKNVGVNKMVTVRKIIFGGKDALNYIFPDSVQNTLSSITKRSVVDDVNLKVTFANQTKEFDGTIKVLPDSTKTALSISGLIAGDVVIGRSSQAFYDDVNVGIGKRVTLADILYSGIDAGNYALPESVYNFNCSITPLNISKLPNCKIYFEDQTKIYDGTTAVKPFAVPNVFISGLLPGSVVTAVGTSASYDNKNVGSNKVVTVRHILFGGKDALNYIIPDSVRNLNCSIAKRSIADDSRINVFFANQNKVFDGTIKVLPDSSKTAITVSGLILQDVVTAKATTAYYSDSNVGLNKTVTLDGVVYSGSDAGNYLLPTTIYNHNSSITPLNISSLPKSKVYIEAQTKVYDGTTTVVPIAVPQVKLTGLLPGTIVTANGTSASYDSKNVGINKVVTVRGVVYGGKDALNYIFPDSVQNIRCSITKRSYQDDLNLKVSFANQTKVFDGTTNVLPDSSRTQLLIQGIILGDIVSAKASVAFYSDANVGANKRVTLGGIVYSGLDVDNYLLPTSVNNDHCAITPLDFSVLPHGKLSIDNQTKVYDGTTIVKPIAIPPVTILGLLPGSVVVGVGSAAMYDNKNVGTNKTVTVSGITYSGKDALNYIFPNFVQNSNCSISKRSVSDDANISVTFSPQRKVYDGSTSVRNSNGVVYNPAIVISGLISGDIISGFALSSYYNDATVGTGKLITLSGISYSGSAVGNYNLPQSVSNSLNEITPMELKSSSNVLFYKSAITKIYDGTKDVGVVPTMNPEGIIPGDDVQLSYTSALYDNENVGNNKTVTIAIRATGAQAGNYVFADQVTIGGCSIMPYPVVIIPVDGQSRAYEDAEGVIEYSRVTLPLYGVPLSGHLSRDPGTDPAKYIIRIGDLNQVNPNYSVNLTSQVVMYEITTDAEILLKWGNTLVLNNAGDRFESYQWYKDDVAIPGAIGQYYSTPDNSLCGVYFCDVIKTNGARVRTIKHTESINCGGLKSYILYPTSVEMGGEIKIKGESDEYILESLANTGEYKVHIFTMAGVLAKEYILDSIDDATLKVPSLSGAYVVRVFKDDVVVLTQKIVVK